MKTRRNAITILWVIIFVVVVVTLILREFPSLTSSNDTVGDPDTSATNVTFNNSSSVLPTVEQDWGSVGEIADWNNCMQICVETVTSGKDLPNGIPINDIIGMTIDPDGTIDDPAIKTTDESGRLISDHTYVDITVQMTCIGLEKDCTVNGISLEQPNYFEVAFADQLLQIIDTSTDKVKRSHEVAYMENLSHEYETDYHMTVQLTENQSIRMRLIYIIDDSSWNTCAVNFTPFAAKYNTFLMDQLGYTQLYIWLNESATK